MGLTHTDIQAIARAVVDEQERRQTRRDLKRLGLIPTIDPKLRDMIREQIVRDRQEEIDDIIKSMPLLRDTVVKMAMERSGSGVNSPPSSQL